MPEVETKNVQFVSGTQYLDLPRDPINWIVQGVLPVGGMCNLYGPAKLGKSFAALQMAHAIANPKVTSWLDVPVNKHGPVAYLQVDTPRGLWAERMHNMVHHLGYDLTNVFFSDTLLIPRHPFNILDDADFLALQKGLEAVKPIAVVIDTLREIHEEDEDKATNMKRVVSGIYNATRPSAVLLVSHSRKDNPDRGDDVVGDQRGSNYIAGRMDCVIKQTSRRLLIKSRSNINERINCHQDKDKRWGEIVRDADDKETKLLTKLLKSKTTAEEKVREMVKELGITTDVAKEKLQKFLEEKMKDGGE